MFTAENFSSDEVFYDYHALNEILASLLAKSRHPEQDEQKFKEMISGGIEERDGVLYYGDVIVGCIVDESDDA